MKYTLGKYTFDPEKPFKSYDDAIAWIHQRHPEVSGDSIRKRLIPKIKEDESIESGGSGEELGESNTGDAGTSKKGNKPNRATTS
jgi:hypothetical protein